MSDLRDLLEEAAGSPPSPVDVQALRRRARRQQLLQATAVVAVVVAVVSVGVSTLMFDRNTGPPVIGQPDGAQTVPVQVPDGLTVEATLTRLSPYGVGSGRAKYLVAAVVSNDLEDTAVLVGGDLSLHRADGERVATAAPRPVAVGPGGQGLLIRRNVDAPASLDDPQLGLDLRIVERVTDAVEPVVAVSDVSYEREPPQPCTVTGMLSSQEDADLTEVQVAMLGYVDGGLSTADIDDVGTVPAGSTTTFHLQVPSAGCPSPDALDLRIVVQHPLDAYRSP